MDRMKVLINKGFCSIIRKIEYSNFQMSNGKYQGKEKSIMGKRRYLIRRLPRNVKFELDMEPKRYCEKCLVYTTHLWENVHFRVRERAKNYAYPVVGRTYVVLYDDGEGHDMECIYFARITDAMRRNYKVDPHRTYKITRCVGSRESKKHFSRISWYFEKDVEQLANIADDEVVGYELDGYTDLIHFEGETVDE